MQRPWRWIQRLGQSRLGSLRHDVFQTLPLTGRPEDLGGDPPGQPDEAITAQLVAEQTLLSVDDAHDVGLPCVLQLRWLHSATNRGFGLVQLGVRLGLPRPRGPAAQPAPTEAHPAAAGGALLVDIRSEAQRAQVGESPGALCPPRNLLEMRLDPAASHGAPVAGADLERMVIVVCNGGLPVEPGGHHAAGPGFGRDTDLDGPFQAWRAAGLPVSPPA